MAITHMGFLRISPSFSPGLPDGVEMVHIVLRTKLGDFLWKPTMVCGKDHVGKSMP